MAQPQRTPAATERTDPVEFPLEELRKHRGRWVAFSRDGSRLIASSAKLADLDSQVRAVGEDPEEVLLERIAADGSIFSGSELS
jgi:hypothetical protein